MQRVDGHLVTGGTGLVGGAIVLELLRRTSATIYCIVRHDSQSAASERLLATLDAARSMYGLDVSKDDLVDRCVALQGDITASGCGIAEEILPENITEVWHCAENFRYTEKYREEIELHNVNGTANVIALAERLGVACIDYVSTAYVAGTQDGLASEVPVPLARPTNNVYEETKIRAERLAVKAAIDTVRILRPSVVVAHSHTLRCPSDGGIYRSLRRVQRFKQVVDDQLGDYFRYRSLSLLAPPTGGINLIPIDMVAKAAVDLGAHGAPSGIYHLTSLDSPTLEESVSAMMHANGMQTPRFVDDARQLNRIDELFSENFSYHHAAWLQSRHFDCTNTVRFCSRDLLCTSLKGTNLTQLFLTHLENKGDAATAAMTSGQERTM